MAGSVKTLKQKFNVADFGRIPETLLTHQIRKGTALSPALHILTNFGFNRLVYNALTQILSNCCRASRPHPLPDRNNPEGVLKK